MPPQGPADWAAFGGLVAEQRDFSDDIAGQMLQALAPDPLSRLEDALETGRVGLAYQPVQAVTGAADRVFFEGLCRIFDPSGAVTPAGEFIDLAEPREIGRRLDIAVLERGFDTLLAHPELNLSLNVSARSLAYPNWADTLRGLVDLHPEAARRLILEITEQSAMEMPDRVARVMAEWRGAGIRFALDDFGAGHTSIRYFRKLSFEFLKIDGSFVRGIDHDTDNQVLIGAIQSIARHFGMATVAEFVETPDEVRVLKGLGVDMLQGFGIGVPGPLISTA